MHPKQKHFAKGSNFRKVSCLFLIMLLPCLLRAGELSKADELVKLSFDYYRGAASVAVIEMTIHRPDWERRQVLKLWTVGEKDSLFTTLKPSKDRGSGTLKKGNDMWIYNPKIKRTIKLPASMMSQAWMGSDFSNSDLAKSDNVIEYYDHQIIDTQEKDGHIVYIIESIPHPDAPVVWGKEILKIRDDFIFLEEQFFDEDGKKVKSLQFTDIRLFGDKLYPETMTMRPVDKPGYYTRIRYEELEFLESLPARYFTLSTLKNPPL